MINSIILNKKQLKEDIPVHVEDIFEIEKERISEQLNPILNILDDDLTFYLEYPYVDKFYRDTFYSFFSKKHKLYLRDSIRISIFDESVDLNQFFTNKNTEELSEFFRGYFTLRPTTYRIIGHSFISPKALKNNNFVCCLCKKTVLVLGNKLDVYGFPFSSQDGESITCSESTIINIMDYFGNKYPEFSVLLPSQLSKILSKQSYERQLPSEGMPTENISYVLKKMGFGTKVYTCYKSDEGAYKKKSFREILYTYIESGIPVIATLSTKKSHHAVLVIGRPDIKDKVTYGKGFNLLKGPKRFSFSNGFNEILISNDNSTPYELVSYNKPAFDDTANNSYKIRSFIVPLYAKVHLEAYQFINFLNILVKTFKEDDETNFVKFTPDNEDFVLRCYLTSNKSYKNYIAKSPGLSEDFKIIVINLEMPKFIWVGEIIHGNTLGHKQLVDSVIVMDATESGYSGHLIFATDSKHLVIKKDDYIHDDTIETEKKKPEQANEKPYVNRNIYKILEFNEENFYTFANNLKGEHTKWKS